MNSEEQRYKNETVEILVRVLQQMTSATTPGEWHGIKCDLDNASYRAWRIMQLRQAAS